MTPTERILSALADRNCDPKRNGKGWSARCPVHDDRNPSLSISEGDDGRALVKCHAKCSVDSVCKAIGLEVRDLMPASTRMANMTPRTGDSSRGKAPNGKNDNGKSK